MSEISVPRHYAGDFTVYVNATRSSADRLRAFLARESQMGGEAAGEAGEMMERLVAWIEGRGHGGERGGAKVFGADGRMAVAHAAGKVVDGEKLDEVDPARVMAGLCCGGRMISLTVRSKELRLKLTDVPEWVKQQSWKQTKFEQKEGEDEETVDELSGNLATRKMICDAVWGVLKQGCKEGRSGGLLLVTGRTGSLKSEIARHVIAKILLRQHVVWVGKKGGGHKPHLLTFEDPVEKALFDGVLADPPKWFEETGRLELPANVDGCLYSPAVDYTPREKGKDAADLKEALRDALRQTPTVFFAGEVRTSGDLAMLVDFAATGHLVVTTAHAGSLQESFGKLQEAYRARTPARRQELCSRLAAVVHMKTHSVKASEGGAAATLHAAIPAIWMHSAKAEADYVARGLSSINARGDACVKGEGGVIGRRSFLDGLLKKRDACTLTGVPRQTDKERAELEAAAVTWDLLGV